MASGNLDLRLDLVMPDHVKTKRLLRELGPAGAWSLVRLWCHAGKHHRSGVLTGYTPAEIEEAAGWEGDPGRLHGALVRLGWLDADGITIHDWRTEQPYLSGYDAMKEAAAITGALGGQRSGEARRPKSHVGKQGTAPREGPRSTPPFDGPGKRSNGGLQQPSKSSRAKPSQNAPNPESSTQGAATTCDDRRPPLNPIPPSLPPSEGALKEPPLGADAPSSAQAAPGSPPPSREPTPKQKLEAARRANQQRLDAELADDRARWVAEGNPDDQDRFVRARLRLDTPATRALRQQG